MLQDGAEGSMGKKWARERGGKSLHVQGPAGVKVCMYLMCLESCKQLELRPVTADETGKIVVVVLGPQQVVLDC